MGQPSVTVRLLHHNIDQLLDIHIICEAIVKHVLGPSRGLHTLYHVGGGGGSVASLHFGKGESGQCRVK